jgi:uncharacterized membrane protein HdeD (DUF308 family)
MSSQKSPGWRRAAQIGLGAIAIILAIIAIVFPGVTVVSIVIILAIALLIVGIEKVISGIFFQHKSRFAAIGLGILVIILAIIALAFPVGATTVLILILAFALMFDGFARIIQGFGDKQERGWIRGFYIGVGVLAVIISVMVLVSPLFGAALAGLLIGIALLIIGIEIISAGIAGREARLRPSMT